MTKAITGIHGLHVSAHLKHILPCKALIGWRFHVKQTHALLVAAFQKTDFMFTHLEQFASCQAIYALLTFCTRALHLLKLCRGIACLDWCLAENS